MRAVLPALVVLSVGSCSLFTSSTDDGGPSLCWVRPHEGVSSTRPGVLGDLVFIADGTGRVIAREQRTGAERWSRDLGIGGSVLGANIIAADGIVVVPGVPDVIALDAASGVERWRYTPPLDTANILVQPPRPGYVGGSRLDTDGDAVYVPAWGASISAVDLHTGAVRWVWGDGNPGGFRSGSMGVRVHGDTLYAPVWHYVNQLGGLSEVWLVALDRQTGRELWRKVFPPYTSGVSTEGAPAVFENLVIFTSAGGHAYAIDRFTTQLAWKYNPNTQQGTFAQVELHGDVVYHDGGDEYIYALDARTGNVRWRSFYDGQTSNDLLVTERRVYVPNGQRILYIFDRATGALVARRFDPMGDEVTGLFATPGAFANGRAFFGVGNGAVCYLER